MALHSMEPIDPASRFTLAAARTADRLRSLGEPRLRAARQDVHQLLTELARDGLALVKPPQNARVPDVGLFALGDQLTVLAAELAAEVTQARAELLPGDPRAAALDELLVRYAGSLDRVRARL